MSIGPPDRWPLPARRRVKRPDCAAAAVADL